MTQYIKLRSGFRKRRRVAGWLVPIERQRDPDNLKSVRMFVLATDGNVYEGRGTHGVADAVVRPRSFELAPEHLAFLRDMRTHR